MKELEYILFKLIANGNLCNRVDCSTDDYEVVEIFGLGSGNIDLKYQKNEVFIKVHAIEDINAEELEVKVFPEINQIVDKLSFLTDTCIDMEENIQIGYKYKSIEKLIKKDIPRSSLTYYMTLSDTKEGVEEFLKSDNYNSYYDLYRRSMLSSYDVGEYMFLYNIILSMNNDNQKKTDEMICKICEDKKIDCKMSFYTYESGNKTIEKYESIFTRLRNEIGHKRDQADYIKTANEIHNNLSALKGIVKYAIRNHIG